MAQNVYEGLFIFDSNKFARERDVLPKAVEEMITTDGGEVVVSRLWEERRLAYEINGQRKGAYWLMYFRANPESIVKLNRSCELHGGILRQLVLKIHPRLVEPILEHAAASMIAPVSEAPAEAAEGEEAAAEPAVEEASAE